MSINWSSFTGTDGLHHAIVADGVTDNTNALNALPAGVDIIGDTGSVGMVKFGNPGGGKPKNWFIKSNMTLHLNGCPMQTVFQNGGFTGAITQQDVFTPLANVFIDGLNITKPSINVTGRMILWNINHMTLTNLQIGNHNGALEFIGSDWEIGFVRIYNSQQGGGNPGIKSAGNFPKVATTPGRPANIYIHDVDVESGDAALQVATIQGGAPWGNISADDYLWERFNGHTNFAEGILVAASKSHGVGGNFDCAISNVIFRNGQATGVRNLGVSVRNEINVLGVYNVLLENVNIIAGVGVSAISSDGLPSPVNNVTFRDCTVDGAQLRAVDVQGNHQGVTFENTTVAAPANPGTAGNFRIGGGDTVLVRDCTIDSLGQDALTVGGSGTTSNLRLINNTITGVTNNHSGIKIVDGLEVEIDRNTITPAAGTHSAIGIELLDASYPQAGAVNTHVTNNDVSAMTNVPAIIFTCNNGQGNCATGNIGFPDQTCVPGAIRCSRRPLPPPATT